MPDTEFILVGKGPSLDVFDWAGVWPRRPVVAINEAFLLVPPWWPVVEAWCQDLTPIANLAKAEAAGAVLRRPDTFHVADIVRHDANRMLPGWPLASFPLANGPRGATACVAFWALRARAGGAGVPYGRRLVFYCVGMDAFFGARAATPDTVYAAGLRRAVPAGGWSRGPGYGFVNDQIAHAAARYGCDLVNLATADGG